MARPLTLLACAFLAALASRPAEAAEFGAYLVPAGGDVRSVRTADVDGDGRIDLVALVRTPDDGYELVVFRTPATPTPRVLFPADHIVRIPCNGARARAGAVALGRFG
ncbi:MAG: VCBS repeat-containing protein, partial [Planctomycetota bacterium]|nr:VCBS repeat-containing protein [Planctomycetota bacterium]